MGSRLDLDNSELETITTYNATGRFGILQETEITYGLDVFFLDCIDHECDENRLLMPRFLLPD